MILKELAVITRTYTDKEGKEKKVWRNIGTIQKHDKEGYEYMVLDPLISLAAIPHEGDRVFVSMFDPKPKESKPEASRQQSNDTEDDQIPF